MTSEGTENARLASLAWTLRSQISELSHQLELEQQQLASVRRERAILRRRLDEVSKTVSPPPLSASVSLLASQPQQPPLQPQQRSAPDLTTLDVGLSGHSELTSPQTGLLSFLRICLRQIESGQIDESIANLRSIIAELSSLEPTKPIGGWPPPPPSVSSLAAFAASLAKAKQARDGTSSPLSMSNGGGSSSSSSSSSNSPRYFQVDATVVVGTLSLGSFAASSSGSIELSKLSSAASSCLADLVPPPTSVVVEPATATTSTVLDSHEESQRVDAPDTTPLPAASSLPPAPLPPSAPRSPAGSEPSVVTTSTASDTNPTSEQDAAACTNEDASTTTTSSASTNDARASTTLDELAVGLAIVVQHEQRREVEMQEALTTLEHRYRQSQQEAEQLRLQLEETRQLVQQLQQQQQQQQQQIERHTPATPEPTTRNDTAAVDTSMMNGHLEDDRAPEEHTNTSESNNDANDDHDEQSAIVDREALGEALDIVQLLGRKLADLQVLCQLSQETHTHDSLSLVGSGGGGGSRDAGSGVGSVNFKRNSFDGLAAAHVAPEVASAIRPEYLKHRRTRSRSFSPTT